MIESLRSWLASQLFDLDEHRTDYCCGWNHAVMHLIAELPVLSARAPGTTAPPAGGMRADAIYPCDRCGVMRTKAQGGTVFTVCDACWDASAGNESEHPLKADRPPVRAATYTSAETGGAHLSAVDAGLVELAENAPEDDTWERRRWDISDAGGER